MFFPNTVSCIAIFGPHAKPHGFWGFRKIVIFDQNLNWYMKHVEYAKYPDVVSHVQTCSTHPGYPVFNILNKPSTNLLCTTHTGLSWSPLTTETSSILPIQWHINKTLVRIIRFYLISVVTIWHHWYIHIRMMLSVTLFQKCQGIMLLSTF